MRPRKSHSKSRQGCIVCKRRRVKCDESGPPCGNCRARSTPCEYVRSVHHEPASSTSLSISPDVQNGRRTPKTPSYPSSRQLLEIQLTHRWTAITYKTAVTPILKDDDSWLIILPEAALQHDFLLHGMFALSAYEIAFHHSSVSKSYVTAALEYQDLAIHEFQAVLNDMNPESYEAILLFSILLTALTLASSQWTVNESRVQITLTYYELLCGLATVVQSNLDYVKASPIINKVVPTEALPKKPLASQTALALHKLQVLNDSRSPQSSDEMESVDAISKTSTGCNTALRWLRECFMSCYNNEYRGWCPPWIAQAGQDYVNAIKNRDRVALLILMYWGVLLEPLGADHWWAEGFGKSLVKELGEEVSDNDESTTKDVIEWAKQQVGLDA